MIEQAQRDIIEQLKIINQHLERIRIVLGAIRGNTSK